MGLAQQVVFETAPAPSWAEVTAWLAARQFPVQVRMIDGQLSLPEETPPDDWRELRLSTPSGMVTLRREGSAVQFVVWGNADTALQRARNLLVLAFAERGGVVETDSGRQTAAEFARGAELPAGIQAK